MNKLKLSWSSFSRLISARNSSPAYSTQVLVKPSDNEVQPTTGQSSVERRMLDDEDYFGVRSLFTVNDLMRARVHYGHRVGSLDPRMKPYLFGQRLGHCIIDLDHTSRLLAAALNFLAHVAYRDGIVLFVAQAPHLVNLVEHSAKHCGEFAHTRRWRIGMFTNANMMFGALTRLPDCLVVLNTLTSVFEQHPAIVEAAKMCIPTIGVVDTNCNPNLITYPVPGNDDSYLSVRLLADLFSRSVILGKEAKKKETLKRRSEAAQPLIPHS